MKSKSTSVSTSGKGRMTGKMKNSNTPAVVLNRPGGHSGGGNPGSKFTVAPKANYGGSYKKGGQKMSKKKK